MQGDTVANIFRDFDSSYDKDLSNGDAYAAFLISKLRSGDLPNGTKLPALSQIYKDNHITYYALRNAFQKLKLQGFLLMKRGQRPIAQYPPKLGQQLKKDILVLGNYYCKPVRLHLNKAHQVYLKYRENYLINIHPVSENTVSHNLLSFTAVKYNELYAGGYLTDNFYYSHHLRAMLQATIMSVQQPGTKIVIPAKTYTELPAILQLLRLDYIEIEMDQEGFDVNALAQLCTDHQVAAVFMMSRASFPTTVYTSEKRIKELFKLSERAAFKIVEIDFFMPWLVQKTNPLLKLAGHNREHVVYVYPQTFLLKEMSDIFVVATDAALLQKIKTNLRRSGARSCRSVAESMHMMMAHKEFVTADQNVGRLIQKHQLLLKEVFQENGFWLAESLANDTGLAIFLRPQHSAFPKDSYSLLKDKGILAVNPDWYAGSAEEGLRFDFSHYIGHHDFEKNVRLVEQVCRSMCMNWNL